MHRFVKPLAITCSLIAALVPGQPSAAESALDSMQSIAGARVHSIESEINSYRYQMIVKVPTGYSEQTSQYYPSVYLLDGGATFPMLGAYYNYLRLEETVPDMIIVGISYGTDDWQNGNHRGTDFTAPTDERQHWGGAEHFVDVLANEILPLVESEYRAAADKRIIFGQSLGGQFVLYSALNRPGLFSGYIASNPALHRNLDYFLNHAGPAEGYTPRLFVGSGSLDEPVYRQPALQWITQWNEKQDKQWQLSATTIDGYGHFSLAPESFRRGLIWVLDDKPDLAK